MISIVVPVYNQHELTDECLTALFATTFADIEVIVVDNGSTPPSRPNWHAGKVGSEVIIIRNKTNLGFPAAVNQGVQAAKGEIIVLLNNDVVVTEGWAEKLLTGLENYAVVSPVTNYCAGLQRVQAGIYEDQGRLEAAAKEWAGEHHGELQEVNFVIGFLMAFRKKLWEDLGPFDESIWPSSGEEIDFCFRARAAGHKVAIARDCYVHHYGSQTFSAMQQAGECVYGDVVEAANENLAKRWGADFWQRQEAVA